MDKFKGNGFIKKQSTAILLLLTAMLLMNACGASGPGGMTAQKSEHSFTAVNQSEQEDAQSTADILQADAQSTADIPQTDGTVYMVLKHDTSNYQITLMDLADTSQICYEYTDGTEFFDKYGEYALREDFTEGKLAVIRHLNSNDTLGAIAFTDTTWDYEDVRNYSVDKARNRISIADTSYHYDSELRVFSNGEETDIRAVGDSDILNFYGIDRKIYAIVVETGHGVLELTNTKLFEGGWLNLGTKMYTKITPDMSMELPEGIYEFSVANDGYGDTGEIRIRRDKTTTIDLNDYKGEGPKLCKVTFKVDVDNAVITINGKKINYKKAKKLKYGVYKLGVYADGYDAWEKQLVINSPKANISILLSENKGTSSGGSTSSGSSGSSNSDSSAGTGSNTGTGSNNSSNASSGTSTGSARAGSMAGSLAGSSHSGSSSSAGAGSSSSGSNSGSSNSSSLANAALGSSLASIITGGNSTDYLDTLSDLVDSLERLNRSSSDNNNSDQSGNGGS